MCAAGIWAWGEPMEVDVDGVKTSVLFLDTEGFESIGKSNVYDDRYLNSKLFVEYTGRNQRCHEWENNR